MRSEAQQDETGLELERAHLAGSPSGANDADAVTTPVFLPEQSSGRRNLRLRIVLLAVASLDLVWLIWIGYGVYGLLAR